MLDLIELNVVEVLCRGRAHNQSMTSLIKISVEEDIRLDADIHATDLKVIVDKG